MQQVHCSFSTPTPTRDGRDRRGTPRCDGAGDDCLPTIVDCDVLHLDHLPVAVPQPAQRRHALCESGHHPSADCGRPLSIQQRPGIQ